MTLEKDSHEGISKNAMFDGRFSNMRFEKEALSLLILLASLAANAQGIVDPSQITPAPGQSLADALLENSVSGVGVQMGDSRFAPNPHKSREIWQNESNATNWTMPSTLSGGSTSAKESRTAAEADSSASVAEDNASAAPAATLAETAPAETTAAPTAATSIAGSWSLKLSDSAERQADITLFQNGDSIFGKGNLNEGNDTIPVTASGSLDANSLKLDLTPSVGSIGLYKLALNLNEDSAEGVYQAFSVSGESLTGNVTGIRTVPQD